MVNQLLWSKCVPINLKRTPMAFKIRLTHNFLPLSITLSLRHLIIAKMTIFCVYAVKKYRQTYRKIRASNLPTNYCKIYHNTVNLLQFITVKLTEYCKYFYQKLCFVYFTVFTKKKIQFSLKILQVYCKKNTVECKIYSIWWADWIPVFDGLKNHDISRYFSQFIVKFYILHCKKTHNIWRKLM